MFVSLAIDDDKGSPSIFELLDKNQQKSQHVCMCLCVCVHTELDAQHVAFVYILLIDDQMLTCRFFKFFCSSRFEYGQLEIKRGLYAHHRIE